MRCFYFFQNFVFFWVFGGVKGQKIAQNDKESLSATLHILETIHHMIVIYGIHV